MKQHQASETQSSIFNILGLQQDPFTTSPDPHFFYPTIQHKSCLTKLEISIRLKRGACLILGEIGTGKTTLCRKIIQILSQDNQFIPFLLLNPTCQSEKQLFSDIQKLLMGSDYQPNETPYDNIRNYLLKYSVSGEKTIVLIIDEAQKLNKSCIEGLRGLLNFETNNQKLIQLIIFSQLELKSVLSKMPNFIDRLNHYQELKPLDLKDCQKLIRHRVHVASKEKNIKLFTARAIEAIYKHSKGYPRKICMLAHHCIEELIMCDLREVKLENVKNIIKIQEAMR